MLSEHVDLLRRIYGFLTSGPRVIPQDWIAGRVERIANTQGDIDALSKRLAYVRTWTYAANRASWLENAPEWREKTREVEDRLSDALHTQLTQRFVDRRTSVLMRRLKQREELVAEVDKDGGVTVEGEHVGRIEGLRFQPDKEADGIHAKTLRAASVAPVAAELTQRVEKLYNGPDGDISFTETGGIVWDNVVIGRIEAGAEPLSPTAKLFNDEMLEQTSIERGQRRLQQWLDRQVATQFEPLLGLKNDEAITGLARGVAFQMYEALGVLPRGPVAQDVKSLEQSDRSLLRKHGVRFGQYTLFMPALLKPAPTKLRIVLWGVSKGMDDIPAPPQPGVVTMPAPEGLPAEYFQLAGYRKAGNRALRLDMLERLADMIRPLNAREGFEAAGDMLSITGLSHEQFLKKGERAFKLDDGTEVSLREASAPGPASTAKTFALDDGTAIRLEGGDGKPARAMETFYTYRILPRGRRQQGDGRREGGGRPQRRDGQNQGGRRDAAPGDGKPREGGSREGGRREGGQARFDKKFGDGKRPGKPGGKPGGKRGGPRRDDKGGGKPKEYSSAPRREKKADPDSPFAILQQLKDKQ